MSTRKSEIALQLEQFRIHLQTERYSSRVQQLYLAVARRFLGWFERKGLALEEIQPSNIEDFVHRELRTFRRRHGGQPRHLCQWRCRRTGPVRMFLRCVLGQWPRPTAPVTALDKFHRDVVREYDTWMEELRGLAPVTRSERATQARQFLATLGSRGDQDGLRELSVNNIDAYVQQRYAGLRRRSIKDYSSNLRIFLQYLHASRRTAIDLGRTVIVPHIYTDQDIPSILRPSDVEQVLRVTRQDRTPTGLRDYAILTLLATYGLRAGEIAALRLDDIDWRTDVIHVRHSKTGDHSDLPLLCATGQAVLRYLQKARPKTGLREVFLHVRAPYCAFKSGTVYEVVRSRLAAAGVTPPGKKGPHTFRHARAVGLLRAGVPLKTIGDVLGHRSSL
jgi:integrase/recombinase XerD